MSLLFYYIVYVAYKMGFLFLHDVYVLCLQIGCPCFGSVYVYLITVDVLYLHFVTPLGWSRARGMVSTLVDSGVTRQAIS